MLPDKRYLEELESSAREMAQGAGTDSEKKASAGKISVEYKDKNNLDPVTEVDRDCQHYLAQEIIRRYPSHGILGEENPRKKPDADGKSSQRAGKIQRFR